MIVLTLGVLFYTISGNGRATERTMSPEPRRRLDFYEIQRRQWKRSLLIFGALILFYFAALGLVAVTVLLSLGAFASLPHLLEAGFLTRVMLIVLAAALLIGAAQFIEARKFGAQYILKRLEVRPPDPSDRYHKIFADTVEEMSIAAGLPRVKSYVIPSFAINSMGLVEADGTAAVAVTEGLLADCTRDELQAVAAHELAHISRGDAFYVTLVCSLANFLEKMRAALEPEDIPPEERAQSGRSGGPPILLYGTLTVTSLAMHLLSTLLSREREILADAAASEICRNPVTLARALYKAHLKSSFVGDFSLTYSPLFIVAPELSSDEAEHFFSRLFNSHPPVMKRIRLLAQQAGLGPAAVIEQVWESQKMRERAKGVIYAFDELPKSGPPAGASEPAADIAEENKTWLIQEPNGRWQGPFGLTELLLLPYFSILKTIRNIQEKVEAPAREFPQVRLALRHLGTKKAAAEVGSNRCPRCDAPLLNTFYEGVAIQACGRCGGKLVACSALDRVLLRREFDFSPSLRAKAAAFREQFLLNPVKKQRLRDKEAERLLCPCCGYRMLARPYNYQYFIPVDKCLSCYKVWFDADELEILQILVEKKPEP